MVRDIKLDMKFSLIYNKGTPQISKILGRFQIVPSVL